MTTEEFITLNLDADVRELALKHAGRTDIDLAYALNSLDKWTYGIISNNLKLIDSHIASEHEAKYSCAS